MFLLVNLFAGPRLWTVCLTLPVGRPVPRDSRTLTFGDQPKGSVQGSRKVAPEDRFLQQEVTAGCHPDENWAWNSKELG
jgi:hypothetical protein